MAEAATLREGGGPGTGKLEGGTTASGAGELTGCSNLPCHERGRIREAW